MTTYTTLKRLALAGAMSAIGFVAYSAGPASAGTNEVTSCRGTTKAQVINCCDTVVNKHGKPQWMRLSGKNCAETVVCKSGSTIGVAAVAAKVCTIKPIYNGKDSKDRKDKDKDKSRDSTTN